MKNLSLIGSIKLSKFQNQIVESLDDETNVNGLSLLQVKP